MTTPSQRLPCWRSPVYLKWVRERPCVRCEAPPPSEAAHVRMGNGGGMGLKPSDYRTVPLCHTCHALQHQIGERAFWWQAPNSGPHNLIAAQLALYLAEYLPTGDVIEALESAIAAAEGA